MTNAPTNPSKQNIEDAYRKLAKEGSQIADIEMESDGDYVEMVDAVDYWAEDEEVSKMEEKLRTILI